MACGPTVQGRLQHNHGDVRGILPATVHPRGLLHWPGSFYYAQAPERAESVFCGLIDADYVVHDVAHSRVCNLSRLALLLVEVFLYAPELLAAPA